ncbi:hypothetical protein BO82DRAFT_399379 [Aspergillus uvarum CBS 121591]|uniref:Uncharacterized protein n=1 Tax=Aspergillus uvarum CBS 121591 TaxID=1448315 RepID=A0A319CH44_9EURO|nr:hypothetical protein BO82DRAFT_399379 [Aspergillus uvarum CBS 121591]PYH84544.1 hypothetical protein BO82DRAFT_399379 [Aspergillus uvarum CBS 121591]
MSGLDCAPSDAPLDLAALRVARNVFCRLWIYQHCEIDRSWVTQRETPWVHVLDGPHQDLTCFLEAVMQSLFGVIGIENCLYDGSAYGELVQAATGGGLELVSYHWGHYAPTLARFHQESRERARKLLDPDLWLTSPSKDWKPSPDWKGRAIATMLDLNESLEALGDPQVEATIRACIQKYVGAAAVARMGTDHTQQPRHPTPFKHGHECQVCCRPLGDKLEAIFWCKRHCGFAAHVDCIREWCRGRPDASAPYRNTCLHCRQPWLSPWGSCAPNSWGDGVTCPCRRRRPTDAHREAFLAQTHKAPRQTSEGLPERPGPPLEWHSLY